MTSFTDDDFLQLKTSLVPGGSLPHCLVNERGDLSSVKMKALIDRLEAAEAYVKTCRDYCSDIYHKDQAKAYETWRKAAGKGK